MCLAPEMSHCPSQSLPCPRSRSMRPVKGSEVRQEGRGQEQARQVMAGSVTMGDQEGALGEASPEES